MFKTIRAKVMVLALLPAILLTTILTGLSLYETNRIASDAIDEFKTEFIDGRKYELSNYLKLAKSTIAQFAAENPDLSDEALKEAVYGILRGIRFDDSGSVGYLFAYDLSGNNVMHGVNQSLVGKNLINFKDPNGVPLIQELIQAARSGGGFVEYSWKDVATNQIRPKLGYAELIEDWNILVGTGLWVDGINEKVVSIENNVGESIATTIGTVAVAAVITLALVIFAALLVAKAIVSPLKRVVSAMDEIAEGNGDLTKRLHQHGDVEIAQLSTAFNTFADQVQDIIQEVHKSTSTLNGSTQQLTEVMQEAERGVHMQRDESDQVATAMTEMTAAAQEVASNASDASDAARSADKQVDDARVILERTIATVDGLSAQVSEGVAVIQRLGQDSQEIGGVIDVIRGIAEQTSLLALNAAIEAARAGETGRGFAVVADEVRSLASKTQESTQQISDMIEKLQSGAEKAVNQIDSISESNTSVVSETQHANNALQQISQAVSTINNMNAQIASAAEEQTAVSESINQNIHKIVEITNDTAQGTQLATSVTTQLKSLAMDLSSKVERYQV